MNYTIIWIPAFARLAGFWTSATDKNAVTAASHRIDQVLATNPAAFGEDRPPDWRIGFDPPLGVVFEVDESSRTVWVMFVGLSNPPARPKE